MASTHRIRARAVHRTENLTGCAIGEVLGMVIGTAAGLRNATTVTLSITLAFVFGYGLTMRGVLRAGIGLRTALGVARALHSYRHAPH
jgi:TctA family transporter